MAAILGVNDEEDTDDLVAADSSDDVLCALGRDEIRRMLE